MITRLIKIKNLGLFRDFKWDESLEDFCRYNLIYGWNGAGKTTLSRLFAALDAGGLSNYPDLQFEVSGSTKRWSEGARCDERIRVFNRDYVLANVEKVGGPNPIFILGAENKEIAAQITQDNEELETKLAAIDHLERERASCANRKSTLFTNVARTIGHTATGESTRSYRRPNAEADFNEIEEKEILDAKSVSAFKVTLGQQQKEQLDGIPEFGDLQEVLLAIHGAADPLLRKTVRAGVIPRLAEHHDISGWVERGVALHDSHNSATCEFCLSSITQDRLDQLADHFSDADRALKQSVYDLHDELKAVIGHLDVLSVREAANLYDELAADYQERVDRLLAARDKLRAELEELASEIKSKKAQTSEELTISSTPDASVFVNAVAEVNAQIDRHNAKTRDFDKEKQSAREALKRHFLSEVFDEANQLQADADAISAQLKAVQEGGSTDNDPSIQDLEKRLADSRAKVSSSHAACKAINDQLALFLGRNELSFEVSGEGYEIRRFGKRADDLSESERTAVAFVYFVVHLSDRDFDLRHGIVVIDDPISSLDANSLFQAFAFLKESVKEAKQVFILTHNFDFMRQVKSWLFHIQKAQRSFYMIKNREDDEAREAFLAPLDRLLMEFESEYHYLFSLLHTYKDDGSLEAIYNFPNIGRKFLETFLAFKVPSHENLHQKMGHIDYDETKKIAILRFVQTHSHARRSDGVLNFDMSLSKGGQTAISDLLSMVESVDRTHYDTLLAAVSR